MTRRHELRHSGGDERRILKGAEASDLPVRRPSAWRSRGEITAGGLLPSVDLLRGRDGYHGRAIRTVRRDEFEPQRVHSAVLTMRPVGSTNHRSLLNALPLSRATSQSASIVGGNGPRLAAGTPPTECRLSA